MVSNSENIGPKPGRHEEDLGIFGPPVTQLPADVVPHERPKETASPVADKEQKAIYARMAANMIITAQPPSTYFVRNPGL